MKHLRNRVVFKTYTPNQISLLPPSLDELIDINHPVRVVNSVIDKLELSQLEQSYKGGGTSSFHPHRRSDKNAPKSLSLWLSEQHLLFKAIRGSNKGKYLHDVVVRYEPPRP